MVRVILYTTTKKKYIYIFILMITIIYYINNTIKIHGWKFL